MKRLSILLPAVLILSVLGSVFGQNAFAGATTGGKVATVVAGKEEGAIDKAFFRKIAAEKPSNVLFVDVRTKFEYDAGHFEGAKHIPINDIYDKGCDAALSQLPKDGYVVFVCATGARAGEMYFGIKDECKYKDVQRFFFLDANVNYTPQGPVVP
jgi:hydroxyacylglutathione hydrolase